MATFQPNILKEHMIVKHVSSIAWIVCYMETMYRENYTHALL
jgi:hypothetical protein